MSAVHNYPTEREVQLAAYQSIHKQLGAVGLIRFIQQFEPGRGDYTKERNELLGNPTVDELFDMIEMCSDN